MKIFFWNALLLMLIPISTTSSVYATAETAIKVEPSASTAHVGETFTIAISVTDVENLYGVEVILRWDASVLHIVNVDVRLGIEDHADGVLHTPIYPYVNETKEAEGKYTLVASSGAPASSFYGTGNIVKMTFNVTRAGTTKLDIEKSELAGKPPNPSASAPRIMHSTMDGFFYPIHIFASPLMIEVGQSINISGFIATAQANVEIFFEYRREGETDWRQASATVKTDGQGNYKYVWVPQEGGKYEIRVTATLNGTKETSSTVSVNVTSPEQPVLPYVTILIVIIIAVILAIMMYCKRREKS